MTNIKHPTNSNWVMFDPKEISAPRGAELLLLNEGGVLIKSTWYEGALAWCYKPVIPKSVKLRMNSHD